MILANVRSGFPQAGCSKSKCPSETHTTPNTSVSRLFGVVPTILQMLILNSKLRGNYHLEFHDWGARASLAWDGNPSDVGQPQQASTNLNQQTDWPTNRPTDQPTDGPTSRPTNQPTNRPTSQLTNWPTNQLTHWLTGKTTEQPNVQMINQMTMQPNN